MIPAGIPLKPRPATLHAAPGTKMPAWLPDALYRARLADAAKANPPPCLTCGEPGTKPVDGDELNRRCEQCGETFDLVMAADLAHDTTS